jgi:uncharacterized protein YxeA
MKKVILVGVAALFVLGCASTTVHTPETASNDPIVRAEAEVAPVPQQAMIEYDTTVDVPNRPSEHATAVMNANAEARKEALNTDYWSVDQVANTRSAESQLKNEIEKKAAAMVMGDTDEPGPTLHDKNNVHKREQMKKKIKSMTENMNMLDGPGPCLTDKYRTDLTMDDLNGARMPGNGLVEGAAKKTYMHADECRDGSCYNSSAPKYRTKGLVNPLDNP